MQGNPGTDGIPGAKGSAVSLISVLTLFVTSPVSLYADMSLLLFFVPSRVLLVLLELLDSPALVAHLDHRELQDLWDQRDSL